MKEVPKAKESMPFPVDPNMARTQPNEMPPIRVTATARANLKKQLEREQGCHVELVWLPYDIDSNGSMTLFDQRKSRLYGEHELYMLFHYKQNEPTDGRATKKQFDDYVRMNEEFANVIIAAYQPGDIVMIHDYQLMLLPSILRKRVPNIYLGFVLHTPFPTDELYRSLTMRSEILKGVLGANSITFQNHGYIRHFNQSCERLLQLESTQARIDYKGMQIGLDVFPIGINTNKTMQSAFTSDVDAELLNVRKKWDGMKIIVGRDRLDSVCGVAQKLHAFEILLERYPEWREKVVLIQRTSQTSIEDRQEIGKSMENRISGLVTGINSNFGTLIYTPVDYSSKSVSKEEYFALLRAADVALITSVREGMSTTALEYVICQRESHGPLIISEFSGTAKGLDGALHINPWHSSDVADTIHYALTMPDEMKADHHDRLYKKVTTNSVQAWTEKILNRQMLGLASFKEVKRTPLLSEAKLLERYKAAFERLFMFDYDGTLTPIVDNPSDAIPTDKIIRILKKLAANPANTVWIISGRTQQFLNEYMGDIAGLGLSAEHGAFAKQPNAAEWENLAESFDMSWQDVVMDVMGKYTAKMDGTHIEKKKIAITWHYREAAAKDQEYAYVQAEALQQELENIVCTNFDVECMTGKMNVEVRPKFINKGEIVRRLVSEHNSNGLNSPDFVFCSGDDTTDEGMLLASSSAIACKLT